MRRLVLATLAALAAAAAPAGAMPLQDGDPIVLSPVIDPPIDWQDSRAVGAPTAGRLVRGVQLPAEGVDFFTYDWGRRDTPMRGWRRWGTDRLVRLTLDVLREYRADNPGAPRVGIADLSRRRGGVFGPNFGGKGHVSHQNGLDVDILYPRRDGEERLPWAPRLVDRELAQDLVDRFVAAGAEAVFTGPSLGLDGPRDVVAPLVNHDDHLHIRIR